MKKITFFLIFCISIIFSKSLLALPPHHDHPPQQLSQKHYHGFVMIKFKDGLRPRLRDEKLVGINRSLDCAPSTGTII